MKRITRILMMAGLLIAARTYFVEAAPVNIPDANLKAAIETELGVTNPEPADMLNLTSLDTGYLSVMDLTGLESATNLLDLELHQNQISDLSPLAGLTNLTYLNLYENQISDISSLAGLTNLTSLDLGFNQISDISPLAGLMSLRDLNLSDNPLNPDAYYYLLVIEANNPGIDLQSDLSPNITMEKMKIKAGKKPNSDSLNCSGNFTATVGQLAGADTIEILIWSESGFIHNEPPIPFNPNDLKNGKYRYKKKVPKGQIGGVTTFQFDTTKQQFSLTMSKMSLKGLNSPMGMAILIGDYAGVAVVDETVINGKKPSPITLLRNYGGDYLCVYQTKVKAGKKPHTDSLRVQGGIATDSLLTNPCAQDLEFYWGQQPFTIASADITVVDNDTYRFKNVPIVEGGTATGSIDLNKCTFKINIKNVETTTQPEMGWISLLFEEFEQSAIDPTYRCDIPWVTEPPMNVARDQFAGGVIDGKIYVFGGNGNPDQVNLKSTETYDPATKLWTLVADNPHNPHGNGGVEELTAAVVNDKLYVFGAYGGIAPDGYYGVFNFNEMYDPATNMWTTLAQKPTIVAAAPTTVYNNEIYLFGGYFNSDNPSQSHIWHNVVECYNPSTDTWRFITYMPKVLGNFGIATIGDKAYLFGGVVGSSSPDVQLLDEVITYDFQTGLWATTGYQPVPIKKAFTYEISAPIIDGKVYLIGGIEKTSKGYTWSKRVDIYNPETDTWEEGTPLPQLLNNHVALTIGEKIYVLGGNHNENIENRSKAEVISLDTNFCSQ